MDFQYIDSRGKDQGQNVRRKSQNLVSLLNDKEKIREVRQKAVENRDKYVNRFFFFESLLDFMIANSVGLVLNCNTVIVAVE